MSAPVLQAIEDELLKLLRPMVQPAGPLNGIVVESISSPDDLKIALEKQASRIPLGILSMGGNASWPETPKSATLAAQVDRLLTYTFIAAFSDLRDLDERRRQLYEADQIFVGTIPDRAFTGLPIVKGWSIDRCAMIASQTLVVDKFYGIIYSFGIRNRAKVFPQTEGVT